MLAECVEGKARPSGVRGMGKKVGTGTEGASRAWWSMEGSMLLETGGARVARGLRQRDQRDYTPQGSSWEAKQRRCTEYIQGKGC